MIHHSDKTHDPERDKSKDLSPQEIKKAIEILNQLPLTYSQEQLLQRLVYQFEKMMVNHPKTLS